MVRTCQKQQLHRFTEPTITPIRAPERPGALGHPAAAQLAPTNLCIVSYGGLLMSFQLHGGDLLCISKNIRRHRAGLHVLHYKEVLNPY